ncbi:hypothetical protein W033_01279 [Mycobacterium tuberculosis TB_RSA123]|nr:hypothetical protein W033_01279 [Mycobacterium tuberculosis TB_RSA123]
MFPSPLGVLGLIREIHCALFKVSVPSRGFGSDDPWGEGMAMMVDEVSVPSRGFGSDDTWGEGMAMMVDEVSVPSRGFGSDDRSHPRGPARLLPGFRPLSGFWV